MRDHDDRAVTIPDGVPQAAELVEEHAERLMKFRASAQDKINYHREMMEFYQSEHDKVTRFLQTDFFEETQPDVILRKPLKGNSRDIREPWERE